jgi:hypothetical protein
MEKGETYEELIFSEFKILSIYYNQKFKQKRQRSSDTLPAGRPAEHHMVISRLLLSETSP